MSPKITAAFPSAGHPRCPTVAARMSPRIQGWTASDQAAVLRSTDLGLSRRPASQASSPNIVTSDYAYDGGCDAAQVTVLAALHDMLRALHGQLAASRKNGNRVGGKESPASCAGSSQSLRRRVPNPKGAQRDSAGQCPESRSRVSLREGPWGVSPTSPDHPGSGSSYQHQCALSPVDEAELDARFQGFR